MPSLSACSDEIRTLQPDIQGIEPKAERWKSSVPESAHHLFSAPITRTQVAHAASSGDTDLFFWATLLWGYRTPEVLRVHNLMSLTTSFATPSGRALVQEIAAGREITDWPVFWRRINSTLKGAGISTISKFLYFGGCTLAGDRALILDDRVFRALKCHGYEELVKVSDLDRYSVGRRREPNYAIYVHTLTAAASRLGVTPDQIELFLFEEGKAALPARHPTDRC